MISSLPSDDSPWEIFLALSSQHKEGFFFDNWGEQGVTYFGFSPQESFSGSVIDPETPILQSKLREMIQKSSLLDSTEKFPFEGGVVSLIGYNCGAEFESFPARKIHPEHKEDFHLGYYPEIYIYDHKSSQLYYAHTSASNLDAIQEQIQSITSTPSLPFSSQALRLKESSGTYGSWVNQTVEYIGAGDIFQANLAHPLEFDFKGSPLELYGRMRQLNPSPYAGVYYKPGFALISNSPELLFSQHGQDLVTRPIAGTRPRSSIPDEDEANRNSLFLSEKEQAEHIMLVDLERNDLGRVSQMGSVEVEELMVCEAYQNVFHIVSQVIGQKRSDKDVVDVLKALFPGGTITGAPKIRSMEIIDELETSDRMYYTGSMGWISTSGDAIFNILIRTLNLQFNQEQQNGTGRLHVGAGIVADSDSEKEFEETMAKAAAWMRFLGEIEP